MTRTKGTIPLLCQGGEFGLTSKFVHTLRQRLQPNHKDPLTKTGGLWDDRAIMKRNRLLTAVAGMLAMAAPLFAHHSFTAQYDATKSVTLKGTITKVEWMNPH